MTTQKTNCNELTTEDLATVVGGGWKRNLVVGGLCIAAGPIACMGFYNGYMDTAR